MRCVYQAPNLLIAGHIQTVLEQHGFDCFVRNAFLTGAVGELPPHACMPEVWVVDDGDYDRARSVLHQVLAGGTGRDQECPHCGEVIEAQFAACWSCGETLPYDQELS